MEIVGGECLILLLDEAEHQEEEAGLLAVSILQYGDELIYRAPFSRRGTSRVPHLHIDTYRQCMNDRKAGR